MSKVSFGVMSTETGVWFDTLEEAMQYAYDVSHPKEYTEGTPSLWKIPIFAYAFAERVCTFSFHPSYGWFPSGFVRDGIDLIEKFGIEKELGRE